jgi:hypothetical protein
MAALLDNPLSKPSRGQPTQRNLGTSPRENCCWCGHWVCRSHSRRGTGRGQERDSPNSFGRGKATRKVLVPIEQSASERASCKWDRRRRRAEARCRRPRPPSRHLLSDRRGSEPRCPPVLGTRSRFIESGRCRGDGRRAHPWGQHNQLRGISELRHSKITGSTRRPPRRPD